MIADLAMDKEIAVLGKDKGLVDMAMDKGFVESDTEVVESDTELVVMDKGLMESDTEVVESGTELVESDTASAALGRDKGFVELESDMEFAEFDKELAALQKNSFEEDWDQNSQVHSSLSCVVFSEPFEHQKICDGKIIGHSNKRQPQQKPKI